MKSVPLLALGVVLLVVTLAVGGVHGRWTNRWGHRPDMVAASQRLEQLPLTVGDWKAKGNNPLEPSVVRLLQCAGSVNRVYENARTGDQITIMVLLGPSGPISVHTPEICYSSRDYRVSQDRVKWTLKSSDQEQDEFWDLRLQANDVSAQSVRVLYGWTIDRSWRATENPRFSFGGSSYVYKLQLAEPVASESTQRDVSREFLTAFLPVLRKHLIEPGS